MGRLIEAITDPSAYDIAILAPAPARDPVDFGYWDAKRPGWWENAEKDALVRQLAREADPAARLALVSRLQQLWYEEAPILTIGHYFGYVIKSRELHGPGLDKQPKHLFNAWISK